jgi:hypothetical protein
MAAFTSEYTWALMPAGWTAAAAVRADAGAPGAATASPAAGSGANSEKSGGAESLR